MPSKHKIYKCQVPNCGKMLRKSLLEAHLRKEHQNKGYSYGTVYNRLRGTKISTCPHCDMKFYSEERIKKHMKTCKEVNTPWPNEAFPISLNYPVQGYPGKSDDEIHGPEHRENSDIDSDADIDPIYYVCVNMQYHDHLVKIEKAYH